MKFRSKTGEAFEDIVAAWFAFCDQKCRECPISCWNNEDKTRCNLYCHAHPHEAARLMGYEVVEDDAVEGMCCDCAHGGPCCSPDENANCSYRKEDGTCWVPYTKETTMQCYRDGGCGPYEGLSCTECPASNPDYKQRHKTKTDKHKIKTVPGHEPLTTAQQKDMAEFIDSTLAEKEEANTANAVEEHTKTHEKRTRAIENTRVQSEGANMDKQEKSLICKILGVEEDEEWSVKGEDTIYRIHEKCRQRKAANTWIPVQNEINLMRLINHPERIIRRPRWTEQEVEDAKAVNRVFGRDGAIKRYSKALTEPYSNLVFDHLYINEDLFPSIKPGQSVKLSDICGGAQ